MSLKRRLKKVEDSMRQKNRDFPPLVIIFKDEADRKRKLKEYNAKYGKGIRQTIIFLPEQKDDNSRNSIG
ncbi:MAG: hypothetical protein MUF05_07435 [Candidatus Omnitrophica bacterium]|jgi:hypothetical protein|nr:hypothetical protein [Candidatus Omnitrophota bacterium]